MRLKRETFNAQYKWKQVKLSFSRLPAGDNIFYACNTCDVVLPSTSEPDHCECGNLCLDGDGRLAMEIIDGMSVLEVTE